jgi:hypothetical protein
MKNLKASSLQEGLQKNYLATLADATEALSLPQHSTIL